LKEIKDIFYHEITTIAVLNKQIKTIRKRKKGNGEENEK